MKKFILLCMMTFACTVWMNAETKTAIRPSELSQTILDDIQKNYSNYSISEAFKVNNKGVITYEIIIQKLKERLILFYDDKGKFIRKLLPVKTKATSPKMTNRLPKGKAVI